MSFNYPIAMDLTDRDCLVVGGGAVALRKIETLLECGARVKVIAPEILHRIEELAEEGLIQLERRAYSASDTSGAALVIAATDDHNVNALVSSDAKQANIPVNVVDCPELCTFTVPAVVRRGDLTIAVFTAGKSPALARRIRQELEEQFGPEYAVLVDLLGEMREEIRQRYDNQRQREAAHYRLLDLDLLTDIRAGNIAEAKRKALDCI